ncbi:MAG: response regulator [Candidatus Nomurabacteria bacterium]|nr:response regulator [Candidatus Nomurabacteria bacterium]
MEGDKKKILIVDDDTFLIDMYALKFSQGPFEVYTAQSAMEALEKIKNGLTPNIILLDIMMPEMDGFEMLEKMINEKLALDSLKIILSNKGQQSDIDRGLQLGASGYIVKASSTPAEVIDKVMEILNKKLAAAK